MHTELTFNLSTLYGFLLVLARVSGVIAFVPIPGLSAGPEVSRIILALALTISLLPVWPAPVLSGALLGRLLGWVGTEAAFGLTIGLAVSFLLEGLQMAAQMIGLQAGYSFASTIDPSTQADTTTLQMMAQLFAGSLFFAFGFDRQVIHILARSLETIPSGTYMLTGPIVEAVTHLGSAIFSTGTATGDSSSGTFAAAGHRVCSARPSADTTPSAVSLLHHQDAHGARFSRRSALVLSGGFPKGGNRHVYHADAAVELTWPALENAQKKQLSESRTRLERKANSRLAKNCWHRFNSLHS